MIDVLVSPGIPEPWLAQEKETFALNGGLSSKELLSHLNLGNSLFIHGSPVKYSGNCNSTVDFANRCHHHHQPSRKRGQPHWQNPHIMDTQTHCLSSIPTAIDTVSLQESMGHRHGNKENTIRPEASASSSFFQNQLTLNAYGLTAPVMKTTHSSSGLPASSQLAPDSPEPSESALVSTKIDGSCELGTEPNWPSETPPPFSSGTESSPSLSSSFDLMEVPNEEPVPYGLPLSDSVFMGHSPNKTLIPESQDTHLLPNSQPNTSFQWSMGTENGSWQSHYHPDRLAWPAPTAMTSSWPMSEHAGIICPETQLVAPYNFTHNSLLSPHNNHVTVSSSAPMPDDPGYSSVTPLGMGTSQTPPANILQGYSCSTSFPTLGPSNAYSEPLQAQNDGLPIRASLHYSDARNALLIEWKRAGLSYKDIKRIGGFKEAESTLRGRFRTLTKAKEQRVRKPKWLKRDIQLLCEAVASCAGQASPSGTGYASLAQANMAIAMAGQPPKVSWKKVAQYIWTHGGSYQFGNATCKKKWCDIHGIKI